MSSAEGRRRFRALVLGGYGNFGAVISRRLAASADVALSVAGRDGSRAESLAARLGASACRLDTNDPHLHERLREIAPDLVISTAGPFDDRGYRVARAALAAGAHYVDIADSRPFVCGISQLDAEARERDLLVVSGASSVPTLSSAVVDHLAADLAAVHDIDFGITTSGRVPGLATVRSVLGYCGKPIRSLRDGRWEPSRGWQGLRRESFHDLPRARWIADCDIPDLELFAARYAGTRTIRFGAGSEISAIQLGTWALAAMVRLGVLPDAARFARPLRRIARAMEPLGTGRSAMFVAVSGSAMDGRRKLKRWELVAMNDDGVNIPCMAAVCLARKLASGALAVRGAMPGVGLVTLGEYLAELEGLDIRIHEMETA